MNLDNPTKHCIFLELLPGAFIGTAGGGTGEINEGSKTATGRVHPFFIALLVVFLLGVNGANRSCQASPAQPIPEQSLPYARARIRINAPAEVVWKSLLECRSKDKEMSSRKTLSQEQESTAFEERYIFPSMFGDAKAVLHCTETNMHSVEFKLFQSDDLKAMEGRWLILPGSDGKATTLELQSYVDPAQIRVPRPILNAIVQHSLQKKLVTVKSVAEKSM